MPYLHQRIHDYTISRNWGSSQNRKGSFKQKIKYLIDFLLRFVGKLAQVAELVNFLALLNGQKYARRCVPETLL